ncbi:hypothetical protein Athai_65330 [Actinocatenispora thailandica]|uniref:Uncharacterized protein n=1 Tax=Actinocatenispora thailandica TaxID=227318 RepID=A0A7R7DW95_9ACTN|nr:hypothetical protein [Actinocatenispora thailandica]BCJ39030.1 hypothetical protein Athai_65330 [Actinocatenispora thailandica]
MFTGVEPNAPGPNAPAPNAPGPNAPAPAAQWPGRLAGSLLLGHGVLLLVAACCARWEMRSAGRSVAAAAVGHSVSAADAAEATAVMAAIARDMMIYSLVMAPLFLLGGIWLLLARSRPSRVVAFVVVGIGGLCCIGNGCCIDYTTQSEVADAVLAAAPPEPAWQSTIGTLSEGWLLTPLVALAVAVFVGLQLSFDNDAEARVTTFLGHRSWPPADR